MSRQLKPIQPPAAARAQRERVEPALLRQVDFIEREIGFDRSKSILGVGCSAGQHVLELAQRGYQATGVDLDNALMASARALAIANNLPATFLNRDARALNLHERFQAALLLREGVFSRMETDEMGWLVLRNVARALSPGGRLIMTAPNAAYALTHLDDSRLFDPLTLRETVQRVSACPDGGMREQQSQQRYYTCPEIRWLLRQSGFQTIQFFAVVGEIFARDTRPSRAHFELGVLADK